MRVLIVGSGGREHALAWRLSREHSAGQPLEVFCSPGNAGIEGHARCISVPIDDSVGQVRLARDLSVDLVVVGPEAPLVCGLAEGLEAEGILVLGPGSRAAGLEGSKSYAKKVMKRAGIPTAVHAIFDDPKPARAFARDLGGRVAVKADGLAAGKGVIVCQSFEEADAAIACLMERAIVGEAGRRVVIEELLEGEEVSFLALCDGKRALPLSPSRDHKATFDKDIGPNTGGMGAFSPTCLVDEDLSSRIVQDIMQPTLDVLADDGTPFVGVLYAGLMLTNSGLKVLEFNVRFGDPETQSLMMRLRGDLAPTLLGAAQKDLSGFELSWDSRASVCVVMASKGYPKECKTGLSISGLEEAGGAKDVMLFHAGTRRGSNGEIVTAGGRVLGVTALGDDLMAARTRAYEALEKVSFEGVHYRRDIGAIEIPKKRNSS